VNPAERFFVPQVFPFRHGPFPQTFRTFFLLAVYVFSQYLLLFQKDCLPPKNFSFSPEFFSPRSIQASLVPARCGRSGPPKLLPFDAGLFPFLPCGGLSPPGCSPNFFWTRSRVFFFFFLCARPTPFFPTNLRPFTTRKTAPQVDRRNLSLAGTLESPPPRRHVVPPGSGPAPLQF